MKKLLLSIVMLITPYLITDPLINNVSPENLMKFFAVAGLVLIASAWVSIAFILGGMGASDLQNESGESRG